ncbi:conserved hypothetical protein [Flavobacterium sp. 9AF]|uniref:hypothetical protein n=1 Tax=Flavobacterium sp. 9AF TaxID=2653142 RepID=UPI0012F16BE6|nr:hypothetical protein [Flavobacterium sp. 9AF]VXA94746.1 conserved hypothetical protein [Flavobacterium sp. 9AF]
MKNIVNILFILSLVVASCSTDNDEIANGEDITQYQATWILNAREDANGNAVSISSCENGRNKIILANNNLGNIVLGSTIYNGNGFICGESTTIYAYDLVNSKIVFTNSNNDYTITYQIISVDNSTLVLKKIGTSTNGVTTTIENPLKETYTKQVSSGI